MANQPIRNNPLQEAEQQLLDKSSKLEVARQAILTQDLQELAKADRDKVRRLENKNVFNDAAGAANGDDVGSIIVCDDYNASQNVPRRGGVVMGVAIAATLVAAAYGLPKLLAPTAPSAAFDELREEQQPDGSWKQLDRRHLKKQPDGSWK